MIHVLMLMSLLFLSGCISLTSSEAPVTTYALRAADYSPPQNLVMAKPVIILVPDPVLPAGFETDKIALYLDSGRQLDYYNGARWAEPLDEVLQDMVVSSGRLAMSGAIFDAGDVRLPADYRLIVTVDEFSPFYQSDASGIPLLKAAVTFTLIRNREGDVVARFTQGAERPATENTLTAVTTGLEELLQIVLAQAFPQVESFLRQ